MRRLQRMVFLGILICVVLFSASAFGFTRHIYQGVFQYSTGRVVPGGTVTVYLAETETLATIYEQETGGSAVEGSQVTSDNNGHYYFFVDEGDYTSSQRFKVVLSKTGYVSQAYDYLEIIPSGTYSGEFDLSDDGILAFGDDEDFGWRYNSTSGNFELVNAVNYVLAWYTPTGGLGTASIANPAINLYDSDATGADRNDEEVGSWTGGFSTVTEDAEISDWAITSFGAATPGTEFTNVFWDGDQAHLYLGVLANYTGANPSVAPLTVADYESLALDFDYAAGTVRLYSPISSTTDIYAADLDWTLGQVTIHAQDPGVVLDEITEGDTDFWLGNNADQGGDDNDLFQIGTGTTIGTNAKITMDTDGNVGIGTASPGEKLEVDGAIKLGTTETEEPLEGTLRWTGADFEGYTLSGWQSLVVSETDFSSEGLSLDDNVALTFGDDDDFNWRYNSTSGNFELVNAAESALFWVTPAGGTGSASQPDPYIALYDSNAAGADRDDEFIGGITGGFSTVTEGSEVSDIAITYMDGGTERTAIYMDGSEHHLYMGALTYPTGANPTVPPTLIEGYESIYWDFDYDTHTVALMPVSGGTTAIYTPLRLEIDELTLHDSFRVEESSVSTVVQEENYAEMRFEGYHTDGWFLGAVVRTIIDGAIGEANEIPTRLEIATTRDGETEPTEAMQIDSDQNTEIYGELAVEDDTPIIRLNDTTTSKTADAFLQNTANDDDDAVLTMGVDDSTGDDTTYVEIDGVNEQVEVKKKAQIGTTIHFSNVTTLSTAQINALKATPITLVPAQGANTIIELVSVMLTYDYATAAFTVGADEDLVIEYADGTDTTASIETAGFLDQSDDEVRFYPSSLAAGADLEACINQGLQIFNTGSGETADGGGELDVRITYRVYETGF